MIKRPLNQRFVQKVRDGIKTTTMRENAWPVGVPIMLYRWSDRPYRSRQVDVCPVMVERVGVVIIQQREDGVMIYDYQIPGALGGRLLWRAEGFDSREDMDEWFRKLVKPGRSIERALMLFRRVWEE